LGIIETHKVAKTMTKLGEPTLFEASVNIDEHKKTVP
jgi:hypothetical protein